MQHNSAEKKSGDPRSTDGPSLMWTGKKFPDRKNSFSVQLTECFDPTSRIDGLPNGSLKAFAGNQNLLFEGENKDVLSLLISAGFEGKVKLVYIDPPFDSGSNYVRHLSLRGVRRTVDLEDRESPVGKQLQYSDVWTNEEYLQFMYERLLLLRSLLKDNGSIFVHLDYRRAHQVRLLMDEIFGEENFRNEIQVRRTAKHTVMQYESIKTLQVASDTIFVYAKSSRTGFNKVYKEASEKQKQGSWHGFSDSLRRPTMRYKLFDRLPPSPRGRWLWEKARAEKAVENYKIFERSFSQGSTSSFEEFASQNPEREFVRFNDGSPQYWIRARDKILVDTNWSDIQAYSHLSDYPTEKSEKLIQRIIEMGSNPGDIILDCFCGSGTTAVIAQLTGRKWISADINTGAIQTTSKRIQKLAIGNEAAGDPFRRTAPFLRYRVSDDPSTESEFRDCSGERPRKNNDSSVAEVDLKIDGENAVLEITNSKSSMVERIRESESLAGEKISDFRSIIDYVLIDDDYDGKVFNIRLTDIPGSKRQLIRGRYEVPLAGKKRRVAVKIVDILGRETVVSCMV